jgi:hypothetical protein
MKQIYDLSGLDCRVGEYPIGATKKVQAGQVVCLQNGLVNVSLTTCMEPVLGYAAENHSGAADALNVRSDGEVIKVSDSPTAVAAGKAYRFTATDGSMMSVTAVGDLATTLPATTLKGGRIKLVEKAPDSANADEVGTVYRITNFTPSTSKINFEPDVSGVVTAGDVFELFPPVGYSGGGCLDDQCQNVVYSSSATGFALTVCGYDTDKGEVYVVANKHVFGN